MHIRLLSNWFPFGNEFTVFLVWLNGVSCRTAVCLFAGPSKRFIGIAPSFEHWKEESYERGCGVGGLLVGFEDLSVRKDLFFSEDLFLLYINCDRSIKRLLLVVLCVVITAASCYPRHCMNLWLPVSWIVSVHGEGRGKGWDVCA